MSYSHGHQMKSPVFQAYSLVKNLTSSLDQDSHRASTADISTESPRQPVLFSAVTSRAGWLRLIHSFMLTSQISSGGPIFSCPPRCLAGWLRASVVPGDVAKPGEIASFHHCSQGLLLFSKGVHLLSHVFVSVVLSLTRSLMKHLFFNSLHYSLYFCCQSSTSIEEH